MNLPDFSKFITPMAPIRGYDLVSSALDSIIAQKRQAQEMALRQAQLAEENRQATQREAQAKAYQDALIANQQASQARLEKQAAGAAMGEEMPRLLDPAMRQAAMARLGLYDITAAPNTTPVEQPVQPTAPDITEAATSILPTLAEGVTPAPTPMPPTMVKDLAGASEPFTEPLAGPPGAPPAQTQPPNIAMSLLYQGHPFGSVTPSPDTSEQDIADLQTAFRSRAKADPRYDSAIVEGMALNAPQYYNLAKRDKKAAYALMVSDYDKTAGLRKYEKKPGGAGGGVGWNAPSTPEEELKYADDLFARDYKRLPDDERTAIDKSIKEIRTGIRRDNKIADIHTMQSVVTGLDKALASKDPGAQAAAIWETATFWNGHRLTEPDIDRIYNFGGRWAWLKTKLDQWAAVGGADKIGQLDPTLLKEIRNAVDVIKVRPATAVKYMQDTAQQQAMDDPSIRAFMPQHKKEWGRIIAGTFALPTSAIEEKPAEDPLKKWGGKQVQ